MALRRCPCSYCHFCFKKLCFSSYDTMNENHDYEPPINNIGGMECPTVNNSLAELALSSFSIASAITTELVSPMMTELSHMSASVAATSLRNQTSAEFAGQLAPSKFRHPHHFPNQLNTISSPKQLCRRRSKSLPNKKIISFKSSLDVIVEEDR